MTEPANPDFPSEPLLRLNAEEYGAMINRVDVDAVGRILASGSNNKMIVLVDREISSLRVLGGSCIGVSSMDSYCCQTSTASPGRAEGLLL
jgi:hypothetical protein